MKFYVNVGERTPEQEAILETYYAASKLLRAAGFTSAHVVPLCTFKPTDTVASIHLEAE